MRHDNKFYVYLSELILDSLEGNISYQRGNELTEILSRDDECLAYYYDFIRVYAGLSLEGKVGDLSEADRPELNPYVWQELAKVEKTAPKIDVPQSFEQSEYDGVSQSKNNIPEADSLREVSRWSLYTAVVSSAALLLILILVLLTPAKPPIVAYLDGSVDAVWDQSVDTPEWDGAIRAKKLQLNEGLARITFMGGADIVLEGPAVIEPVSQDKLILSSGKLAAHVDRQAVGFSVETPAGKILDLGTEFGVEVSESGGTAVGVFQGEVALFPSQADKININSSEALLVDRTGFIRKAACSEIDFVRNEEFNARILASKGDSYGRWLAHSYQLRRDPDLVAHYDFQREESRPEKLINRVTSASSVALNGGLGTSGYSKPEWVDGRWAGKTALKFSKDENDAVVIPSDPLLNIAGPITILVWVKCPDIAKGGHIISCRNPKDVSYQFAYFGKEHIDSSQRNRLQLIRYSKGDPEGAYSDPPLFIGDHWRCLAVTHDGTEAKFYIDGELYSEHDFAFSGPSADAEMIVVGNVIDVPYSESKFNGIIGEIAVFDRTLQAYEIEQFYQMTKP
ncbi:FecR protein [Anaerohalosphaera lusitana]|uniref:FecR protein n=1 Tax=Anaerohalosphaera lusitana TaxID=1936003 RepID=A0A1U9NJY8_9BACT|nr:LamG-like jellyroll fold domain-containing protein [Anaerohalosphaera lusitana]AQT68058.1 FecR protein [Anaerohalosphaera lusitana]